MQDTIRNRLLVNWQYSAGEVRAAEKLRDETVWLTPDDTLEERCGVAGRMPTIDDKGRLYPCCAPLVKHPRRAYATVTPDSLGEDIREMEQRPALQVIRRWGPKPLMRALMARGLKFPTHNSGICNQCRQMLAGVDLAELDRVAEEILTAERAPSEM